MKFIHKDLILVRSMQNKVNKFNNKDKECVHKEL